MSGTPSEIMNNNAYSQVEILAYEEVIPFVFRNIKIYNLSTVIFYFTNALYFIFLLIHILTSFFTGDGSFGNLLLSGLLGFIVFPIFLIPLHEILHALAYKIIGAPRIRIGMSLSQYLFYVAADKFVAGFYEMIFVALAPFVLISVMLVYFSLVVDSSISTALLMTLFAHGTMCIGDFAVLSFFFENGRSNLCTFDLFEEKKAYFYLKS